MGGVLTPIKFYSKESRLYTLPETNISPENRLLEKPSFFRGDLLVSGSVTKNGGEMVMVNSPLREDSW